MKTAAMRTGWRAELEVQAARLGVDDRIHWTGPIYGEAKWGALYGIDAFVLTSHQENFSIAVAESLGCGTPVLISDQIDIWREIEAAGAGLVAPDTVAGAGDLLAQWFALSPDAKTATGRSARTLSNDQFNVARTGPALIETIEGLV